MREARRNWPLLGGALLVLAALASLGAQWWQLRQIPSEQDWSQAAQAAAAGWQPGDAFRVEPWWDSRPRVFLQDKAYLPAQDPTWFDLSAHRRVWVLAEADRLGALPDSMPAPWAAQGEPALASTGRVGAQLFVRPQEDTSTAWDIFSALPEAQVSRVDARGQAQRCQDFDSGQQAWHCRPRDPWMYVGESLQPLTNDVHRCVWAMPVDKGRRLEIRFEGVPGGELRGHYGLTLEAVRSSRGKAVHFAVQVDGEVELERTLDLHQEGWTPFTLPLAQGRAHKVVFSVQSQDKLDRFFCFAARVTQGASN